MIQKGTQDYKKAQEVANKIQRVANYTRWNDNNSYKMFYNPFYRMINAIKETDTFASKIATTIDEKSEAYSSKIAFVSSKQSWIIACVIVEENINIEF
jgi:hypothetical protein